MRPRTAAALAWTVLICGLCWIPGDWAIPAEELAGGFSLGQIRPDKIAHVLLFLVLAALWSRAVTPRSRAFGIAASVAIGTEFGQLLMANGRTCDLVDLVANAIGIGLGLLVARWLAARPRSPVIAGAVADRSPGGSPP